MPNFTYYLRFLIDAELFKFVPGAFTISQETCEVIDKSLYYVPVQTRGYMREYFELGDELRVAKLNGVKLETFKKHYWRAVNKLRADGPMRDMVYDKLFEFIG